MKRYIDRAKEKIAALYYRYVEPPLYYFVLNVVTPVISFAWSIVRPILVVIWRLLPTPVQRFLQKVLGVVIASIVISIGIIVISELKEEM